MKAIYKLTSAIVVAVVLTAGTFYLWTSKSLSERQEKITVLQGKVAESQEELADKEATISSLEDKIENTKKFWRLLLRGIEEHQSEALANRGAGESDFDDFHRYYEEGCYEDARYFADSVDVYYDYVVDDLVEAKGCFLAAKKYAPSERPIRLVENYIKLCEYGIDLYSEIHEAGEYYSTACSYYAKEQWSQGNEALEEANRHVDAYDSLIGPYDECLSNITSLLEE